MKKKKAVLALNGNLQGSKEEYLELLGEEEHFFLAVDGGVILLEALEIMPDVLLGDFDSLSEEKLEYYTKSGIEVLRYPVKKDETDGELAVNYCLENGLNEAIVIGSQGGRLDHHLANIFLLEYAWRLGINLLIKEPGLEVGIFAREKSFYNCEGQILSLIPLSDEVKGLSIKGCQYNLADESLLRYKTRGISNKIIEKKADLFVREGILIYIRIE